MIIIHANDSNNEGPLTVLMKNCPSKCPDKSFYENDIFSMKMIFFSIGPAFELLQNCFSHWTSTYYEIWAENSVILFNI